MTSPGQAFNAQGQGREAAPQVTEKSERKWPQRAAEVLGLIWRFPKS